MTFMDYLQGNPNADQNDRLLQRINPPGLLAWLMSSLQQNMNGGYQPNANSIIGRRG